MAATKFFVLVPLLLTVCFSQVSCLQSVEVTKVTAPAIFAFGDSYVDTGNNNHIAAGKGNYAPYGVDYPGKVATGRFSNGLLVIDFIAQKLGLPTPTIYQNMSSQNFTLGINYASAGAGALRTTRIDGAVNLYDQVTAFNRSKAEFTRIMGAENATRHISNAIFWVQIGTNDINSNVRLRNSGYFVQMSTAGAVIAQIERLYSYGARRFAIVGVGAIGCIPMNLYAGFCTPDGQEAALGYNYMLATQLHNLRTVHKDANFVMINYFDIMTRVHDDPEVYGFENSGNACCELSSNPFAVSACQRNGRVCGDRSKYVYMDLIHTTEAFNKLAAETWWSGPQELVWPINVQQLASL